MDIATDVKVRKYDNKTVSSNGFVYTFNSSFSWVHFNVFVVLAFSSLSVILMHIVGSIWVPVDDSLEYL